MFKYEVYRQYRYKLDIDRFREITGGQIIAMGKGFYPDIDKDKEINWVAEKGTGDDFAVYYNYAKEPPLLAMVGGEKIVDMKIVQELLNCTNEVLERYRL